MESQQDQRYVNQAFFNKKYKLNNRISDAFPETTKNNYQYMAYCHKILAQLDLKKIQRKDFYMRSQVLESDLQEIKHMHREWFPIPYHQQFFDSLINPDSMINTILIELDISQFLKNNNNKILNLDFIDDFKYQTYVKQEKKIIVGMIIYNYREVKYRYMRYSLKDLFYDDLMTLYIMTIGVVNELRIYGLGTVLINRVKQIAENNQLVKYIYLHMVTYNESGSNFYKKNGFSVVDYKQGHYEIEESQKDAYIFVYYVNGSQPPREIKEVMKSILNFVNLPKHVYKLFCQRHNSSSREERENSMQKLLTNSELQDNKNVRNDEELEQQQQIQNK